MRVKTKVEKTKLYSGFNGLLITCTRCGHAVKVYGRRNVSARLGSLMLKEQCPQEGKNYYVVKWLTGHKARTDAAGPAV